jgi:alpha-beta hydrolase superfamily lysophospholipase
VAKKTPTRLDDIFVDSYGVTIHYHRWPVPDARGVVQLAHGLGEHAMRYEPLVADLAAAGWEVWANEHRGHGPTGVEQWQHDLTKMGRLGPGGLSATMGNLVEFRELIAHERPSLPTVFLGHSWGSLMGQILLNQGFAAEIDAVVLTGSTYRMPGYMNAGNLNAKHKHLGTTGAEWLSRDEAVWRRWVNDPLAFEANTLKLFGPIDAAKLIGVPRKAALNLPMLLMVGSDDSLGGERGVRRLERAYRERAQLDDITVKVYPQARHEVFNETNRDDVVADLVEWLGSKVSS